MDETGLNMSILYDLKHEILNQKCCRIDIRKDKSFFIGLGKKCLPIDKNICVEYYGFWEIENYYTSWRIIKDNKIVLGSEAYYNSKLQTKKYYSLLKGKTLLDIIELTPFDVSFLFSDNIKIDFFACSRPSYRETFCILRMDGVFWEKTQNGRWKKGQSTVPKDHLIIYSE